MTDPTAAADALIEAVPEVDPKLVRLSATYLSTRYADRPSQWGIQQRAVWVRFAAFLKEAGLVSKPVDVDAAFTNTFVEPR